LACTVNLLGEDRVEFFIAAVDKDGIESEHSDPIQVGKK
jgi:hypothetical protein